MRTTGDTSPAPPLPKPSDWSQHRVVQVVGGTLGGLALGVVPFAGLGQQVLTDAGVLPPGTPPARLGLAAGAVVGGTAIAVGGVSGDVAGLLLTLTGPGALVGVPLAVASTVAVVGGAANVGAGLHGLVQEGVLQAAGG